MSIETRKAVSEQMEKHKRVVRSMTGKMGFDENIGTVNWKFVRLFSNLGYRFMPKEKGVHFYKIKLGDVKGEISIPDKMTSDNFILYLHGGGFVSGSATASRGYCSMLAKYSGCRIVALNYALAPEHPYPCGVDDCVKAYRALQIQYPDCKIALVGDSGGATLCLAVTFRIQKEHGRKPACVTVHSPLADLSEKLDRSAYETDDFTVKESCLKPLREIYVGNADVTNPEISPIYGDMKDFPPLFISCDKHETLYCDAISLYQSAEQAGVAVNLIEFENTFHAFATIGTGSPETKQLLEENINFIKNAFSNDS